MVSECCFTGYRHEGTPNGQIKTIHNIKTYVATPEKNAHPDHVVLLLTDFHGIWINNQLLADNFAEAGYLCIMPDLFNGDVVTAERYDAGGVDIPAWLSKHGSEATVPIMDAIIKHIHEDLGIKKIGATGYCFGAKYVTTYMNNKGINAGFIAHPSLVVPEDLSNVKGPLTIAVGENDPSFGPAFRHQAEELLISTKQNWQINLYGGAWHGFASRGDLADKNIKFAKERAFQQAVDWFNAWL